MWSKALFAVLQPQSATNFAVEIKEAKSEQDNAISVKTHVTQQ